MVFHLSVPTARIFLMPKRPTLLFLRQLFLAELGGIAKIFVGENDKVGRAVRLEYLYPKQ